MNPSLSAALLYHLKFNLTVKRAKRHSFPWMILLLATISETELLLSRERLKLKCRLSTFTAEVKSCLLNTRILFVDFWSSFSIFALLRKTDKKWNGKKLQYFWYISFVSTIMKFCCVDFFIFLKVRSTTFLVFYLRFTSHEKGKKVWMWKWM